MFDLDKLTFEGVVALVVTLMVLGYAAAGLALAVAVALKL
jgi:hypothetical protein